MTTDTATTERNTAGNKGFAIAGFPCFADTFTHAIIDFKWNS